MQRNHNLTYYRTKVSVYGRETFGLVTKSFTHHISLYAYVPEDSSNSVNQQHG